MSASNRPLSMRTGGQILIDALCVHGVEVAFGVPGESYLAALDALYERRNALRYVLCRQEGGAAFMAEAYGKLTGRPGVCFVTRGPGACNASIGVHTAFQDSTPMVLLVGQVRRGLREREAFQEVDFKAFFAPLAKWVAEVPEAARIPEFVSRAFHLALAGRPGPVVLALPEDVLAEAAAVADGRPHSPARPVPAEADLLRLREILAAAERPVVLAGGGGWSAQACRDLDSFATRFDLPVATAFRCQDYLDNASPQYVGDAGIAPHPALARRLREADLILALGPRLDEIDTQAYTLLESPRPRQALVHVHPGAEELGRVYAPDLAILSGLPAFLAAAAEIEAVARPRWADWRAAMRAEYMASLAPRPQPGTLDLGAVVAEMARQLPRDAILCNGAGNYAGWLHRYFPFRHYPSQLAPRCGAMGYGLPAAIAAKIAAPERTVVALTGDGCFLMTGQEMATAALYRLPIVVLVVNNGMFGTIRMHQERRYPGRTIGTDLANPDFAAFAASFGAHAERVTETEVFAEAFARALACGGPALIELCVAPEAISTGQTLTEIRAAAVTGPAP